MAYRKERSIAASIFIYAAGAGLLLQVWCLRGEKTVSRHEYKEAGRKEGTVQFWQDSSSTYSVTEVIINGQVEKITMDVRTGQPKCGTLGCASFLLPAGIYNYYASETWPGTKSWKGIVQIGGGECQNIQLH
jgi:hypothetical protein